MIYYKWTITLTEIPWKIIDKMFNDNPYTLVSHHLDSYNDFFDNWTI